MVKNKEPVLMMSSSLGKYQLCLFILFLPLVSANGQLGDFDNTDFRRADSVAKIYAGHSLNNLIVLSHKLTKPLSTDVEKFRAIYTWVCENIEGDPLLFMQNERQREKLRERPDELKVWSREFSRRAFAILIRDRKGVCTGYAYLIRELSVHAGLSCNIIDGYGRTIVSNIGGSGIVNHSWNAVKLNGKWYLCDATWSAGATDFLSKQFIRHYDLSYFLARPELFIRNHYPQDSTLTLLSNPPTLHEFLNGPIIYVTAFRYDLQPASHASLDTTISKGEEATFEFRGSGLLPADEITLRVDKTPIAVTTTSALDGNEIVYTTVVRFNSKGVHYVHFLNDDQPLYTFRATVK
ncbi:MAG: transglutaminase domain-containing protein [Chryseolinea sp.]